MKWECSHTLVNALFLEQSLSNAKVKSQIFNSFDTPFVETFTVEKALEALKKYGVIICSGGLSHPFFTTDSLSALRSLELRASKLLKATNVDGVYDKDPKKYKNATKFKSLDFEKALELKLQVMDQTAFALLQGKKIDICVFDLFKKNAIIDAVENKKIGTMVKGC